MSRQSGAGPDFPPCVAGNQVLELSVEFGFGSFSAVHVRLAQDASPYAHARFVAFSSIHRVALLCREMREPPGQTHRLAPMRKDALHRVRCNEIRADQSKEPESPRAA